ncbi:MAG: DUF3047 domain-containing protein [Nitrospinae bacterium]|nr:DUF3047 domain-containing protein [Nitrospinota bacterium]
MFSFRLRKCAAMAVGFCIALVSLAPGVVHAQETVLGRFSAGDLTGWEPKSFEGETSYRLIKEEGGETVLEAVSEAAASGLVLKRKIDLTKTPILIWRWRIERPVNPPDELSKEGDDFAARVYFLAPGAGWLSFPDSVVYVWASGQPVGSAWPNPYTKKAHMVAVDSGAGHAGQWRTHRRNMRADFKRYFGRDITGITHIAIMTDTDNSKLSARGWYGDIRVAPAGPEDKTR